MKKKGFTLVELLAVIVILAVIALIATPMIMNIIEKVKISAAEESAKGYLKAIEWYQMKSSNNGNIYQLPKEKILEVSNCETQVCTNYLVDIKGEYPYGEEDYLKLDKKGNVEEGKLTFQGYEVIIENKKIIEVNKIGSIRVKNIQVNENEVLELNSKKKLEVIIEPKTATNQAVKYESSNSSILSIDEKGNMQALQTGEVVITITSEDNKKIKAECRVSVVISATGLTLNYENIEVNTKKTVQLVGTIEPSNTTLNSLNWASSNENIAYVDDNGLVRGIKEGEATITATTTEIWAVPEE